jgi:Dyp-type peroxidase family
MTHKRSTGLGGMTNLAVLAPVKSGMVLGFEPISHLERLRKVLDALQSARQNVRESELQPPVFPDAVGRFGIIHHFRYAIVPPVPELADQPDSGTWRLSLNVTFDGGWEPYMRVIYRDLGTLLDLLFCHCDGYPDSRSSRFETYCAWVRRNEIEGGLFYADASMTLGDHHYLAEVEQAQRDSATSERKIATLAVPSAAQRMADARAQAMANPLTALVLPMRTLKGLYRLSTYFPKGAAPGDGDLGILRRFAQEILEGPREVMKALDSLADGSPAKAAWTQARLPFADELDWLDGGTAVHGGRPAPLPFDPAKLQSHILGSHERMTHGCVVLLRIRNREAAITHVHTLAALCGPVPASGIGYLIAFTHAGLKALGIAAQRLDAFPQEFVDGMEARCALLGDVRGNHPDRWTRPLAYGKNDDGHRVDTKAVHALVQLRLTDPRDTSADLHHRLGAAVDALQEPDTGLRVLAVQPTRSYRDPSQQTSGHFDFVDGLSQPQVCTAPPAVKAVAHSDLVSAGELLLGHGNDRGDAPDPDLDPLQVDGSFLVVRKLRQRVDNLDRAVRKVLPGQRQELLSKMMGRQHDGTPLVPLPAAATGPNDFNYDAPGDSDACPMQSHARRANPRDGRTYTPRILRRGMSYGPKSLTDRSTQRGVVFMAYCASIAEQFETIQRWIAGGNSSGVSSAQADPFLRVPQAGESTTFRYLDACGQVTRVTFDDQPLVQLEWGLYLFVPALPALRDLHTFRQEPAAAKDKRPRVPAETAAQKRSRLEEEERERVRQLLDDPQKAKLAWALVRDNDPAAPQGLAYGRLVGRHADVLQVMKDDGTRYSVRGYGQRMHASIGVNLLGMDPGFERKAQLPLNRAILAIGSKEAFDLTLGIVHIVLGRFPNLPPLQPGDAVRRPIDLVSFSDLVMAALCSRWIGLPDEPVGGKRFMAAGGRQEEAPAVPRCPGNFATASRFIFAAHPRPAVELAGQQQGQSVLKAVEAWLATGPQLGTLAGDIKARLVKVQTDVSNTSLALSLAGVLLGFPPTVQGNFIRTLETWIKDEALWQHQQALFEATGGGAEVSYASADAALRSPLLATMRQRPVPEMLWRSPVKDGAVDCQHSNRVVLGIASALTDDAAPDLLMFGRDAPGVEPPTVHGCPGYDMAMGVLLAMLAGLLKAGTLRPTGSPVLLILTPGTSAAPPPSPSSAAAATPAPGARSSPSA